MALWNEKATPATAGPVVPPSAPPPERNLPERNLSDPAALAVSPRRPTPKTSSEGGESVIAANLTIEGKIEGSGNVRMAGRFKGDVRIDGNFSIEPGAHLTGQVLAGIVVVGGELQGNIESAKRVDVQEGGVIVGDVKAGSITVAAGSRMRGHVEFGWEEEKVKIKPGLVGGGS
jgi:cytoskeletal protein CcmA (bactofilin family)